MSPIKTFLCGLFTGLLFLASSEVFAKAGT
jgi:hypothetical protein